MKIRNVVFFAVSAFALTAVGCGKASDPGPVGYVPGSVLSCAAGQFGFNNGSCVPDFNQACWQAGGIVSGSRTCDIPVASYVNSYSGILPADNIAASNVTGGLMIRQGDVISFYNGMGSWGSSSSSSSSYLGGLITVFSTSYNCKQVSLTGVGSSSTGTHGGLPAGLIATDGVETFFVGASLASKTINHTGLLRMGMNVPANLPGICGSWSGILRITTH